MISGPSTTPAIITKIRHKTDVNTGEHISTDTLKMNEIGDVEIASDIPLVMRSYSADREFGTLFSLIDSPLRRSAQE